LAFVPEPGDPLERLQGEVERLSAEVAELRARVQRLEPKASREVRETQFGLTAVNRIGALTLAIGIIFFFKYAVDNQWLGARGRTLLGVAGGLLLICAGEWLRARGQRVFAQGIAGCGLAILYITCYAAFAWYRLLGQTGAAACLIIISAVAIGLSLRYAHAAIAALGFAGGLLTPILLTAAPGGAAITLSYLLLLDATCVLLVYKRLWLALAPLTGAETIAAALFLTHGADADRFAVLCLAMGAIHFMAAAALRGNQRVRDALYATGHGFVAAGLLREVDLQVRRSVAEPGRSAAESEFGSLFLAIYGIGALAWGIARNSRMTRTIGLVLIGIVIAKLYLWDVWFLERLYRMTAFGGLGILLLAASWIYSRSKDVRG
jgi:uncharacterized membrane protein